MQTSANVLPYIAVRPQWFADSILYIVIQVLDAAGQQLYRARYKQCILIRHLYTIREVRCTDADKLYVTPLHVYIQQEYDSSVKAFLCVGFLPAPVADLPPGTYRFPLGLWALAFHP